MTHLTPRLLAITPATRRKVAPGIEGNDDDLDELANDEGSRVSLTKIMTLPFPQETCRVFLASTCHVAATAIFYCQSISGSAGNGSVILLGRSDPSIRRWIYVKLGKSRFREGDTALQ